MAQSDRKKGNGQRPARSGSARGGSGGSRSDRTRAPRSDRRPLPASGDLPKWVRDEINRMTPKERREPALRLLAGAAQAFAEGRYGPALGRLTEAKELAPRSPTIRELLGLTAYRMGRWKPALQELRAYRRFTGDTTHMPVEMDVLRAQGRSADVHKTWELYRRHGGSKATDDEIRVVYASFLLEEDQPREAWKVIDPGRLGAQPPESALRRWYVAARVAARLGDRATGKKLLAAVERNDVAFPGLDELRAEL